MKEDLKKNSRLKVGSAVILVAVLMDIISWTFNFDAQEALAATTGQNTLQLAQINLLVDAGGVSTLNNASTGAPSPDSEGLAGLGAATIDSLITSVLPHTAASPTPITFSGKGTVEDGSFYSPMLKRNMPYRIYMPPNYDASNQRYPVLYMLHGLSGSYKEWVDYKLIDTVDAMISEGKIKPILVVLPSGDQEYWVDHADNGPQWGAYTAYDVVNYIDATYRTIPNRQNRAIGGLSMGAYGALQLAFNFPQVFSIVGAHSPALRTKDQAPAFMGDEAFYEAHDPVSLAQTLPLSTLNSLNIWIDIGAQDDVWLPRATDLNNVLNERGVAHRWNVREGGHGGPYWIANVANYLQFYGDSLPGK